MAGTCGCKGARSCLLCEDNGSLASVAASASASTTFTFTDGCLCSQDCSRVSLGVGSACPTSSAVGFAGVTVLPEFITPTEEFALCTAMDAREWALSQSGRRKQDYGPKVNFKRQKVRLSDFSGLPAFAGPLLKRLTRLPASQDFVPVELCNLEYTPERGACIAPHKDDSWLWGERLVTFNLLSTTVLTFQRHEVNGLIKVRVPLPPRSLLIVSGPARHEWEHAIERQDIQERRIAVTLRELSDLFQPGGAMADVGEQLRTVAASFEGQPLRAAMTDSSNTGKMLDH